MLKNLLKDSVIYTLPSLVSRGMSFFLIPLYTRVLTTTDYGSFDLFLIFVNVVNLTVALEVSQGLARYFTSESNESYKIAYASSAFWFTLCIYTLFIIPLLIFNERISIIVMGQLNVESAFIIGVLYIWSNGMFYLIQNQFRWELRSREYAFISILMSMITAIVSVLLAYFLGYGLIGLLLGLLFGNLVSGILGLWLLRNSFKFCFDLEKLIKMLSFSYPLVFSGIAVWLSLYIDRIMIKYLMTISDVGLYGLGYRISSISSLAMVGFQGALTPLIYKHYHEKNTPIHLAKIFRYFIAFVLILFLAISFFAESILHLIVTEEFYSSYNVIVFLVPAIILSNMYIFTPGLAIAKKTHYFLIINIIGAFLNILLNYSIIPLLGIKGAALATLLSYLIVFIIYMVLSQKLYYVPHKFISIICVTILVSILAWYVPLINKGFHLSIFYKFLAIIFCIVIFFKSRLISLKDFKALSSILSK